MNRLVFMTMLVAAPLLAQSTHPPAPSGTITGRVTCADTQRPARFAEVYLVPRVNTSSLDNKTAVGKLYMVNVNTGLDGTYTAALPPGEYYVVPQMDGYILQLQLDPDAKSLQDSPNYDRVFAHYSLVRVVADHSVNVDVSMTRGAVISGRALFEDGSPVVHQNVQIHPVDGKDGFFSNMLDPVVSSIGEGQRMMQTDDSGRYRFSGLPPGKYSLSVTVEAEKARRAVANEDGAFFPVGPPVTYLNVYAPSAFRESEQKPVEIHAVEVRLEENIEIDTTKLHNVHGQVLSAVDHHPLSGGIVRLVETATPPQVTMVSSIQGDGSYSLPDVPSGEYTLIVERGADVQHGIQPDDVTVLKRYANGNLPILVADEDVIAETLELTEQK